MADKIEYQVVQDGDGVKVQAEEIGSTIGRSPGASIEIIAPADTVVDLRTSNGAIEVDGMADSGSLDTSNGKITLANARGDFDVRTSNGAIVVTEFVGTVTLSTGNGGIDFDGELTPGGRNELTTSNSSITVKLRGTPSVRLDASTSNGKITTDLPVLTISAGDKRLSDDIGDGEAELRIRTSNGSVKISWQCSPERANPSRRAVATWDQGFPMRRVATLNTTLNGLQ
jgi:DUF4097 and DUF4098 domain-containing protein YvlB